MMEPLCIRLFALVILVNFIGHIICNPLEDEFTYSDTDSLTDDIPQKRLSHFIRIGKALSSFVRIGKNDPDQDIYPIADIDDDDGEMEKRKSAFVRIGRGDFEYPNFDKRLSSFVRIGRDMEGDEPDIMSEDKRGGGAFVRMGKFPSSAYVRNRDGMIHSISPQPYYRRSGRIGHSSFIRIGKRDTMNALRQMNAENADKQDHRRYMRLGKELSDSESNFDDKNEIAKSADDKRMSSFVRIGRLSSLVGPDELYRKHTATKTSSSTGAKRFSKFVRIGKGIYDGTDKRMSSFVRIGKNNLDNTADKRQQLSHFVRIGKVNDIQTDEIPEMRGLGKADSTKRFKSSFVRIGKSDGNMGIDNSNEPASTGEKSN